MSFYSIKEITDVLKKYFGKDKKLDLSNDPDYLEKNDVKTFLDSCDSGAYTNEITKIDSSMPTKDTVIFTYSVKITEDEKTTEEKFSLTFKKEDSNWVYSSYKKI